MIFSFYALKGVLYVLAGQKTAILHDLKICPGKVFKSALSSWPFNMEIMGKIDTESDQLTFDA